jgi:hypothetical protein
MKFAYASGSRPLDGFIIKRGIGRGGFGEVYFATSDAGKELALKHIERNLEVELRGVGQCLNLKHPNLIDLYDIRYDDQGDAWVVMEYVAGASLKDTIDRNPNGMPLDQVNFWFRGIAEGTAYLHEHGIVHRDLKPGNIFEDSGYVKIGDYGLSKFISTSRRSGQTESVGTFHYMAPEIGKGVYGKEIDIYALGIVLYEMLTGRVPFDGESSHEIIMKHLTADPDLSGVPQPYRAIIQRALQKDPEKRFHNAAEMIALLSPASNPSAGTKPGPGPVATAAEPRRSNDPFYIGDESEGIEFGPLQEHPEKALAAARAKANGHAPRLAGHETAPQVAGSRFGRLGHWWNHGRVATLVKVGLLVLAAIIAIASEGKALPLLLAIGAVYVAFLGVRFLVRAVRGTPAAATAVPVESPAATIVRSPGWQPLTWEQHGRQLLRERTGADRLAELTGSMLAAALIAGVLAVAMAAIGGETLDDSANPLNGPVWLWLLTTIGAWLVLAAGKCCECTTGEKIKRRFGMLALGLLFGAIAFVTHQFLMVELHDGFIARSVAGNELTRGMYDVHGAPRLPAFLAYFGAVFLTVSWWRQCDPLRSSRLRIGSILMAVLIAWLWQLLWPFPQPWGFMLVGAISIATQLSAPWISPGERTAYVARRKQMLA